MLNDELNDEWSGWLLNRRHGGDAAQAARVQATVDGYVERVLEGAPQTPNTVMADIGSGEGVVAWRAIERAGQHAPNGTALRAPGQGCRWC